MNHLNDLLVFMSLLQSYEQNVDEINGVAQRIVRFFNEYTVLHFDTLLHQLFKDPLRIFSDSGQDINFDGDTETLVLVLYILQTKSVPSLVLSKFKFANRFMIVYAVYYLTNVKLNAYDDSAKSGLDNVDYDNYYNWLINNNLYDEIDLESPIQCTVLLLLAERVSNPELKQDLSEILYKLLQCGNTYYKTYCLQLIVKLKISVSKGLSVAISHICLELLKEYNNITVFVGDVFGFLAIYDYHDINELNKKDSHDIVLHEMHSMYIQCFNAGARMLCANKNISNITWFFTALCAYFNVILCAEKDVFTFVYRQWEDMITVSIELANSVQQEADMPNSMKMWVQFFINNYNVLRDRQILQLGIYIYQASTMTRGDRMSSITRVYRRASKPPVENLSIEQQMYHDQRDQLESLLGEICLFFQDRYLGDNVSRYELDDVSKLFITLDLLLPDFGFQTSYVVSGTPGTSFCECLSDAILMFYRAFGDTFFGQYSLFCMVDIMHKLRNSGIAIRALINELSANGADSLWVVLARVVDTFITYQKFSQYNQVCIKQIISIFDRALNEGDLSFIRHLLTGGIARAKTDLDLIDLCLYLMELFQQERIADINNHALLQLSDVTQKLLLFYAFYAKDILAYGGTSERQRVVPRCAKIINYLISRCLFERSAQSYALHIKKDDFSTTFQSSMLCNINLLLPLYLEHQELLDIDTRVDLFGLYKNVRSKFIMQKESITDMDYFYNALSFYGILIYQSFAQNWRRHEITGRYAEFCMQFFDDQQVDIGAYCNLLLRGYFPQNQVISYFLVFFACGIAYYVNRQPQEKELLQDERFLKFVQILLSSFSYCLSGYNILFVFDEIVQILNSESPLMRRILAHLLLYGFNGCIGRPQKEQYFDYVEQHQLMMINLSCYQNVHHLEKSLSSNKYSYKLQFDEDCIRMLYLFKLNQLDINLPCIFRQGKDDATDDVLTIYDYNFYVRSDYLSGDIPPSVSLYKQLIHILSQNENSYQTMYFTAVFLLVFVDFKIDLNLRLVSAEFSDNKNLDDGLPPQCYLQRITNNIVKMQEDFLERKLIYEDIKEALIYNSKYIVQAMLTLYLKAFQQSHDHEGANFSAIMRFLVDSNIASLQILYLRQCDLEEFLKAQPLFFISFLVDLLRYSHYNQNLYRKFESLLTLAQHGKLFNYGVLLSHQHWLDTERGQKSKLDVDKIMQYFKDIVFFDGILSDIRYQYCYNYSLLHSLIKPKLAAQVFNLDAKAQPIWRMRLKLESRVFGIFVYLYVIGQFKPLEIPEKMYGYLKVIADFDIFLKNQGYKYRAQDFSSDTLIVVDVLYQILVYLQCSEGKMFGQTFPVIFDVLARLLQFQTYCPAFLLLLQPLYAGKCFFEVACCLESDSLAVINIFLYKMLRKESPMICHASNQPTYLVGLRRQNSHAALSSLAGNTTFPPLFMQPEVSEFCIHIVEMVVAPGLQIDVITRPGVCDSRCQQKLQAIYLLIRLYGENEGFVDSEAFRRFFGVLVGSIYTYDAYSLVRIAISLISTGRAIAIAHKCRFLQEITDQKCLFDDSVDYQSKDKLAELLFITGMQDIQKEEFVPILVRYLQDFVLDDRKWISKLDDDADSYYKCRLVERKIGLQKKRILIFY